MSQKTAEDVAMLRRFMPPEQRAIQDQMREITKLSEGGVIALSLAQEAIREWCDEEEWVKVIAFLMVAFRAVKL